MRSTQHEFPFMEESGEEDPPPLTDADAPPEDDEPPSQPSPEEVVLRVVRDGQSRREILKQVREIRGLLEGQGRSSVPGTAPLVDTFERARREARTSQTGWDPEEWAEYLEHLESLDDARWVSEYPLSS